MPAGWYGAASLAVLDPPARRPGVGQGKGRGVTKPKLVRGRRKRR